MVTEMIYCLYFTFYSHIYVCEFKKFKRKERLKKLTNIEITGKQR